MLRTIAAILQNRVAMFEYGVVHEVFGLDRTSDGVPAFELLACGPQAGVPLDAGCGVHIVPPYDYSAAAAADLVVVPAGSTDGDYDPASLTALRDAVDRGARVLTVCSGAFLAAHAGILDGRRCATHWRYSEQLAREFPSLTVDADVLFVDDGPVTSSAGTAAGIDAALHIVRQEFGPEVANRIARRMVVAPHRDGGQRQYVEAPVPSCDSDGFGETLTWMIDNLDADIAVDDLARRTHMSPRTFARRFVDEVGVSPHKWLTEQRVLHAQRLLESTTITVDDVARRCGFGSATLLRHHFSSLVGVSPGSYRQRFTGR